MKYVAHTFRCLSSGPEGTSAPDVSPLLPLLPLLLPLLLPSPLDLRSPRRLGRGKGVRGVRRGGQRRCRVWRVAVGAARRRAQHAAIAALRGPVSRAAGTCPAPRSPLHDPAGEAVILAPASAAGVPRGAGAGGSRLKHEPPRPPALLRRIVGAREQHPVAGPLPQHGCGEAAPSLRAVDRSGRLDASTGGRAVPCVRLRSLVERTGPLNN